MPRIYRMQRIPTAAAVTRLSLVMAGVGFVMGVIAAFWAAVAASTLTIATGFDLTGFGWRALILFPFAGMIVTGMCGIVAVFLFATLYNIVAGLFGGIEVELEESQIASVRESTPETELSPEPDHLTE